MKWLYLLCLWAFPTISAYAQQCTIEYTNYSCGPANAGSDAYQKNNSANQRYRITTEMRLNGSHYRTDVNDVDAGDRVYVGCTRDDSHTYTFAVTGCVAK